MDKKTKPLILTYKRNFVWADVNRIRYSNNLEDRDNPQPSSYGLINYGEGSTTRREWAV